MTRSTQRSKRWPRRKKKIVWLLVIVVFLLFLGVVYKKASSWIHTARLISPVPSYKDFVWESEKQSTEDRSIEKLLDKHHIAYKTVSRSSSDTYHITLKGNEEVVVSLKKPIEAQISSLQLVLTRITIEGKRVARLDFRFDKPVITLHE